jgi:hypothetical protein
LIHPIPGAYKYGDLALQVGGVSRIETIKYGFESRGTQTRAGLRWRGAAATLNYRAILTSERAPYRKKNKAIVTKEMIRIKSGHGPQRGARYQDELVD